MNLYQLSVSLQNAIDVAEIEAENNAGVISDALFDDINAIELALDEKRAHVFRAIKNAQAQSLGIDAEIKRLQQRKKYSDNVVSRLRAWFALSIPADGCKTVEFNAFWGESEAVVYAEDFDPANLPIEMQSITVKPIAAEVKKAIKSGVAIDGVQIVSSKFLTIR